DPMDRGRIMRRNRGLLVACLLAPLLLASAAPSALAGRLYRAIELGPGHDSYTPAFTTDVAGNRLVLDASGRVAYPFPATRNLLDDMSWQEVRSLPDRMPGVGWPDRNVG